MRHVSRRVFFRLSSDLRAFREFSCSLAPPHSSTALCHRVSRPRPLLNAFHPKFTRQTCVTYLPVPKGLPFGSFAVVSVFLFRMHICIIFYTLFVRSAGKKIPFPSPGTKGLDKLGNPDKPAQGTSWDFYARSREVEPVYYSRAASKVVRAQFTYYFRVYTIPRHYTALRKKKFATVASASGGPLSLLSKLCGERKTATIDDRISKRHQHTKCRRRDVPVKIGTRVYNIVN